MSKLIVAAVGAFAISACASSGGGMRIIGGPPMYSASNPYQNWPCHQLQQALPNAQRTVSIAQRNLELAQQQQQADRLEQQRRQQQAQAQGGISYFPSGNEFSNSYRVSQASRQLNDAQRDLNQIRRAQVTCSQNRLAAPDPGNLPRYDWDGFFANGSFQYRCRDSETGEFVFDQMCFAVPQDDDRWPG